MIDDRVIVTVLVLYGKLDELLYRRCFRNLVGESMDTPYDSAR
jgi:hypothetical protein